MENHASADSAGTSSSDDALILAARRQAGATGEWAAADEPLPPADTFPGYEIVRLIHRGGQGVVYLALQQTTRRRVALKVVRNGAFSSADERMRIEREVEILSRLKHPNIVTVTDCGEVEGKFYYVMDYIPGEPLNVQASASTRSVRDTIESFVDICDAVNAAHLKGIIHRDLKPGNIQIDARGRPHIVDFGLAKVAGYASGSGAPAMTMTGQFIGSLPWASPEQAEGIPEKVDIRTDVYSLGVILYQLLTGAFPYEVVGNMRDVMDNIVQREPARPTTVGRKIGDEVETIVLKCLSKDRDRRYQSAGELARDLRRYLAGEPIEAKRDSGWYLITKSIRRYRWQFGAATAFVALLCVFGISMGILAARQTRLRVEADIARNEAEALHKALAMFFTRGIEGGIDQTVVQMLDGSSNEALQTARGLSQEGLAATVEARLRKIIGDALIRLGRWESGLEHLEWPIENESKLPSNQVNGARHSLAVALRNLGRLAESEMIQRELLASFEQSEDVRRFRVMTDLARNLQLRETEAADTEAEKLYLDAISGLEDEEDEGLYLAITRMHYGNFLVDRAGEGAEPHLNEAVVWLTASRPESVYLVSAKVAQARLHAMTKGTRRDRDRLREAIESLDAELERSHSRILEAWSWLAIAHTMHGAPELARPIWEDLFLRASEKASPDLFERTFRIDHARTQIALGEFEQAERVLEDVEATIPLRGDRRYAERKRLMEARIDLYEASGHPERVAEARRALEQLSPEDP